MTDRTGAFRKSTYSGAANANCVEVALAGDQIVLRDTDRPGHELTFTPQEWEAFVAGTKDGEFDDLT